MQLSKNKQIKTLLLVVAIVLILGGASTAIFMYVKDQKELAIAMEDPTYLAEIATQIKNITRPEDHPKDKPVIINHRIAINSRANDPSGLRLGTYLALKRTVETYAWEETKIPEKELQGLSVKASEKYKYEAKWLENPIPWQKLKNWVGHQYVEAKHNSQTFYARIGFGRLLLNLDTANLLKWENVIIPDNLNNRFLFNDRNYIYDKDTALTNPKPGDTRFKYKAVHLNPQKLEITVLGAIDFNKIVPFFTPKGTPILRVYAGNIEEFKKFQGPSKYAPDFNQNVIIVGISIVILGFLFLLAFFIKKD